MALLLKHNINGSKGIIVFNHKEWPFLHEKHSNELISLREKYFLGFNVGSIIKDQINYELIDFAFTYERIAKFREGVFKIPLLDSNFLPQVFYNQKIKKKYFDICAVSSSLKLKRNIDLLDGIKKLNKRGIYPNVILIITQDININNTYYDIDLKNEIDIRFSDEEKNNISLFYLSKKLGFKGVPQKTISWIKNNSKFFYAGSEYEGACRSSAEALICGCKIIYYKNTLSGIPRYLNEKNSYAFEYYKHLDKTLETAINEYKYTHNSREQKKIDFYLSETYTNEKLYPYLKKLYDINEEKFDGNLINTEDLSNSLPGHKLNVPWKPLNYISTDIITTKQFKIFLEYISNELIQVKPFRINLTQQNISFLEKLKFNLSFIRRKILQNMKLWGY